MVTLLARRLLLLPLQALGVVAVVFVLVHLLPGDPAYLLAGPLATRAQVETIKEDLGLTEPLPVQFVDYLSHVARGDLGRSWYTGNAVTVDIVQRAPATLELITLAMVAITVLGLLMSGLLALERGGMGARLASAYGFVAGALPDFWVGLVLIFVLYSHFAIGASPTGQISSGYSGETLTGLATVDALMRGDFAQFSDAISHLVLPLLALVVVYMGPVVRVTASAAARSAESDFMRFAASWGIAPWRRSLYALLHVMPIFIVSLASTYGYLLGGAVLIETVFSWGGLGQYAVQAVTHSDYAAIEGFVIVAGIFTVLVYTAADVLQMVFDPRIAR